MKIDFRISSGLVAMVVAGMAGPAFGQVAPVPKSDSASAPTANPEVQSVTAPASDEGGLDDIIVTAQRREESLQRAAVPIAVVSPDALIRQNVTSPAQLGNLIPALDAQSGGGPNITYFVRGVGNFSTNALSDPALAVNFDGVYIGRPTATNGLFFDLERLELLKGPQGTLYGRNATAGALNILPARPRIGENSGFVVASYGNYSSLNAQGALNVALGDNAAFRIAGNVVDRDGFLSDGTSDAVQQSGRAQLLVELTPDFTVRIAADYSHTGGRGVGANYQTLANYSFATRTYNFQPGLDPSIGLSDPRSQALRATRYSGLTGNFFAPLNTNNFQNNQSYGFHGEFSYDTGAGTLTVIPAYREAKIDTQFSVPAFVGRVIEDDQQVSLEARFAGERVGIFDYLLGAYYFDEDVKGNYSFAQTQLNSYQDFNLGTESYAFFGRATAHLSDRLRLVGGLRYTNDIKFIDGTVETVLQQCRNMAAPPACPRAPFLPLTDTADQITPIGVFGSGFPGGVPVLVNGVPTGAFNVRLGAPISARQKADKITYRAAVEFDLGPRSLLYASYETGFRSGGFALTIGKETFGPEQLKAFTVGMKNRLFDNRLQLNIEGFYWKYRDQQIAHFGLDRNGANSFFTENLGKSTVKGVEVDGQLLLTPTTLLTGNVQYLDSVFDDFRYLVAAPAATAPLPAIGCPFTPAPARPGVPAELEINCSGKRAFQSPKWTVTMGAQQTIPLDTYKIVLAADTQYKTSRVIGFEYLPGQFAPSFWRSNATLTFGRDDDKWAISAFVNNIEKNRQPTNAVFYAGANVVTLTSSDPRTYGVRGSFKF